MIDPDMDYLGRYLAEFYPLDPEDEACDHEEFEVDWEGRATCDRCQHSWWLTSEQFTAHMEMMARVAEDFDRQMRRETHWFWRRWDALLAFLRRQISERRPRYAAIDSDDEIPF